MLGYYDYRCRINDIIFGFMPNSWVCHRLPLFCGYDHCENDFVKHGIPKWMEQLGLGMFIAEEAINPHRFSHCCTLLVEDHSGLSHMDAQIASNSHVSKRISCSKPVSSVCFSSFGIQNVRNLPKKCRKNDHPRFIPSNFGCCAPGLLPVHSSACQIGIIRASRNSWGPPQVPGCFLDESAVEWLWNRLYTCRAS